MQNYRAQAEALLTYLAETENSADLIITVGQPPMIRVSNDLRPVNDDYLTPDDAEHLCVSILTKEQANSFLQEKELDISYHIEGVGRYRINMFYQRGCIGMVARIIHEVIPSFEALCLPPVVKDFAKFARGLVLVTGPIGSGKSTTIAAMVDYINETRPCHIVCIEDPVEYIHTHKMATIEQREVGIDTKSFNEALRRVLRQSMNVVVIGEMRDRISAQAAVTLAETGHLTLGTLHTNGTVNTINRLIDMFPPEQSAQMRSQLAGSLSGVIWQQLIPRNGGGLIVACEVMKATPGVRALIRSGKTHEIQNLIQAGSKHDMCTMQQTIEMLAEQGAIDPDWLAEHYNAYIA